MITRVSTQIGEQKTLLLNFVCNVCALNYHLKISLEAGALIDISGQVSFLLWLDYHNLLLVYGPKADQFKNRYIISDNELITSCRVDSLIYTRRAMVVIISLSTTLGTTSILTFKFNL